MSEEISGKPAALAAGASGGALNAALNSPEPAAGAEGGGGGGNAVEAAAPAAGVPEYLQGIDQGLIGETDADTIIALNGRMQGLRQKLSEGKAEVPEKFEEYEFKFDDEFVKENGEIKADDPLMGLFAKALHGAGVPGSQAASFTQEFLKAGWEAGMLPKAISNEQFYEEIGPSQEAGKSAAGEMLGRIDNMLQSGLFGHPVSDKEAATEQRNALVEAANASPTAFKAIQSIMKAGGEAHVPLTGGAQAGDVMSVGRINELYADPRYDSASPSHDKAWRRQVDAKINAFQRQNKNG